MKEADADKPKISDPIREDSLLSSRRRELVNAKRRCHALFTYYHVTRHSRLHTTPHPITITLVLSQFLLSLKSIVSLLPSTKPRLLPITPVPILQRWRVRLSSSSSSTPLQITSCVLAIGDASLLPPPLMTHPSSKEITVT